MMKKKSWPITPVDERAVAPARFFADGRARDVRIYCIEHSDHGDIAHAEVGIALMSFKCSDLGIRGKGGG